MIRPDTPLENRRAQTRSKIGSAVGGGKSHDPGLRSMSLTLTSVMRHSRLGITPHR